MCIVSLLTRINDGNQVAPLTREHPRRRYTPVDYPCYQISRARAGLSPWRSAYQISRARGPEGLGQGIFERGLCAISNDAAAREQLGVLVGLLEEGLSDSGVTRKGAKKMTPGCLFVRVVAGLVGNALAKSSSSSTMWAHVFLAEQCGKPSASSRERMQHNPGYEHLDTVWQAVCSDLQPALVGQPLAGGVLRRRRKRCEQRPLSRGRPHGVLRRLNRRARRALAGVGSGVPARLGGSG